MTSTKRIILLATASLACAETMVLKNFTLIDGTGKAPMAGAAMVVTDGRIHWVGAAANVKVPAGADTVDLGGKFVMPGIINLHGHLGNVCLLYTSPSPRDRTRSRMPSSA